MEWKFIYHKGSQPGLFEGVHLRLAYRREKMIYILFISKYLYIYRSLLFSKIIICLL